MDGRAVFKRYKRLSKNIFLPVDNADGRDIYSLLRLYSRFSRCADLRELYRDIFVPQEERDSGHDKAIVAARQRSIECETILSTIFTANTTATGNVPCNNAPQYNESHPTEIATTATSTTAELPVPAQHVPHIDPRFTEDYCLTRSRLYLILHIYSDVIDRVDAVCARHRFNFNDDVKDAITEQITMGILTKRYSTDKSDLLGHDMLTDRFLPEYVLTVGIVVLKGESCPSLKQVASEFCQTCVEGYNTKSAPTKEVMQLEVFLLFLDKRAGCLSNRGWSNVLDLVLGEVQANGTRGTRGGGWSPIWRPGLYMVNDNRLLAEIYRGGVMYAPEYVDAARTGALY